MAQTPNSDAHAQQIKAGIKGRRKGHEFEESLSYAIVSLNDDLNSLAPDATTHVKTGNPAYSILEHIMDIEDIDQGEIIRVDAWWLGGLATSGDGDILVDEEGRTIDRCKSDVLVQIDTHDRSIKRGISIKTCSKATPTNDQMFFTTANAFCNLLDSNGIEVPEVARKGMNLPQFC